MAGYQSRWIEERSGTTSARRMSAILGRMSRWLESVTGERFDERPSRDPYRALVSCIISLRTKDDVTAEASARLFEIAPDPESLVGLSPGAISKLIYPAGFYRNKARQLKRIAGMLLDRHGGLVPDSIPELLELPGVGRKTANLVITRGHGKPGICVDTHVHRICNRVGFVKTRGPDLTEQVLRARLPRRWWIPINGILVRFGQKVCAPVSPRCSACPAMDLCKKEGVGRRR